MTNDNNSSTAQVELVNESQGADGGSHFKLKKRIGANDASEFLHPLQPK